MSFKNKSSGRLLLPFGLDYSDVLSQGQSTEKPEIELPIHGPLTPSEESAIKQSLAFARLMYDGHFYTGSPQEENKTAPAASIQRYSDRYKKVKKVGRSIDEYPYQLEFFPEELYLVMGITKQKKKLLLSSYKADGGLKQFNVAESETAQSMLEKLKSLAEDLDADTAPQNDDDAEEEDFDDEFEEDDDDDYNAEKYFDGGDDDMGDGDDDEAAF